MRQIDAFEADAGRALKAAGMKQAISNEEAKWQRAYRLIGYLFIQKLAPGTLFTGEQLRRVVEDRIGPPHHPNVWGAMFNGVIRERFKAGDVEKTGQVIDATNSQAHRRAIRLYRRT